MDTGSVIITKATDEKKKAGGLSARVLMDKFQSQGFRCYFTGEILEREDASLDHVQPISKGGGHTNENIELVHAAINRMKGRMTAEEFIDWCVKVAVHSGLCVLKNEKN